MKKFKWFFFILAVLSCKDSFSKNPKNTLSFEVWKKHFIERMSKKGLPKTFLRKHLNKVRFDKRIIDKDRNQVTSSTTINYKKWMKKWVGHKPNRIDKGKDQLKKYSKLLGKIEKKYGVDKEVIISLWGIETLYGKITGKYKIIPALSTLSYDLRRRKFFENELYAALKIIYQGHIGAQKFLGSWAGAMGQCQFMPSSFLRYAQDYDGDGKKDIWNNKADIFASIANFLKHARWKKSKKIGILVKKRKGKRFSPEVFRSPAEYSELGLRHLDGSRLEGNWKRKLAVISHKNSPFILRASNYGPILKWNKSSLFAALNIFLMDAFQ
jgi:membrane-bound lytic murein transglycosylase B